MSTKNPIHFVSSLPPSFVYPLFETKYTHIKNSDSKKKITKKKTKFAFVIRLYHPVSVTLLCLVKNSKYNRVPAMEIWKKIYAKYPEILPNFVICSAYQNQYCFFFFYKLNSDKIYEDKLAIEKSWWKKIIIMKITNLSNQDCWLPSSS